MTDGTPSVTGSAFGPEFAGPLETDEGATPDSDLDWLTEDIEASAPAGGEQPTQPEVVAPPQEPAATPPTPAEGTAPPAQEPTATTPASPEQPAGEQPPVTEPPKKLAGRYESVEKLEDGYKNAQRLISRREQELAQERKQVEELRAFQEQVQPYLPALRELLTTGQVPDLEAVQQQAQVQQQARQMAAQQAQQLVQQQAQSEVARTVSEFMVEHPDIVEGGALDEAIGELIGEFQGGDPNLFPVNPTNLNLAYELAKDDDVREVFMDLDLVPTERNLRIAKEAATNPQLAEVLRANPTFVDRDEGVEYAKKLAQWPGMVANGVQQVQQQQLTPEQARRVAHVTTGGSGAPVVDAPGATPKDEFDLVLDYANQRTNNIFGLPDD